MVLLKRQAISSVVATVQALYMSLKTYIPLVDIAQIIRRESEIIDIFPDEVSVQTQYLQSIVACRELCKTA